MNAGLETLLANLADSVDAQDASLFLRRSAGAEELMEFIAVGRKQILEDIAIPKAGSIVGWVLENGRPVISNDVKNDERFYDIIDLISGVETRSILAVPVTCEGVIVGVIEVINKRGGKQFTDADALKAAQTADVILSHVPPERIKELKRGKESPER